MSKDLVITREDMEPVVLREIGNGCDTTSAIRKAAAAYIPGLVDPHGHEARCLDKALKSMSTQGRGLLERVNAPEEYRNVWALTHRGQGALAALPPLPAAVAPAEVPDHVRPLLARRDALAAEVKQINAALLALGVKS